MAMKLLIIPLFAILTIATCKPVTDKTELPHSREFYAGYIKAITDNFDQLFETDRQVRSTKDEDDKPKEEKEDVESDDDKFKQKRDIIVEDQDENLRTEKKNSIPVIDSEVINPEYISDKEDFEESSAVRRGIVEEGSGNNEFSEENIDEGSGSEDDEISNNESKKTNEDDDDSDDEITQKKSNKATYFIPQKEKTGLSARRSDGEGMAPQGDEEEDIREATADMQRSSRDQSPDDLQKMAQSTVTFLPTNVRNYKATPFVRKVFHYDPPPIPYGAFHSDTDMEDGPVQRNYPNNVRPFGSTFSQMARGALASSRSVADPFSFVFPMSTNNAIFSETTHAETRNNIENIDNTDKVPSSMSKQTAPSVPVEEPEIIPPPNIAGPPFAAPQAEKHVKASTKDDCCCCQPCCCHQCCCCQPITHHVTHHHHHMNDVCHHHHHHDIYHHNTKIHPHHECCHHVHCHQHVHPHEHLHVCHHHEKQIHHHTPCCSCCHDDCCHHGDCCDNGCCHQNCGCHDCGCHSCGCNSNCCCNDCGCGHHGGSYGSY